MLEEVKIEAKKILELKEIDKKYYGIRSLRNFISYISLLLFPFIIGYMLNIFFKEVMVSFPFACLLTMVYANVLDYIEKNSISVTNNSAGLQSLRHGVIISKKNKTIIYNKYASLSEEGKDFLKEYEDKIFKEKDLFNYLLERKINRLNIKDFIQYIKKDLSKDFDKDIITLRKKEIIEKKLKSIISVIKLKEFEEYKEDIYNIIEGNFIFSANKNNLKNHIKESLRKKQETYIKDLGINDYKNELNIFDEELIYNKINEDLEYFINNKNEESKKLFNKNKKSYINVIENFESEINKLSLYEKINELEEIYNEDLIKNKLKRFKNKVNEERSVLISI